MTTFAALLRSHRQRAGLTQYRLAHATGINVGTINHLELHRRLPASRKQVRALAAALNLTRYQTDELLYRAGYQCAACPMRRYAGCEEERMKG